MRDACASGTIAPCIYIRAGSWDVAYDTACVACGTKGIVRRKGRCAACEDRHAVGAYICIRAVLVGGDQGDVVGTTAGPNHILWTS